MGVDVYLFDTHRRVRQVLPDVYELVHDEAEWRLTAQIPLSAGAQPGEYLGFTCVDGAFRLFGIDEAEDDEQSGVTVIDATDAAVWDLTGVVVKSVKLDDAGAAEAFGAILSGTGCALGTVTATGRTGDIDIYYQSAWKALQDTRATYDARLVVRYGIADNAITGMTLDVLVKESVFRGRFFDTAVDAESAYLTRSGRPVTVLYGLGNSVSTGDNPQKLTFADVVWSAAGGDPADKPAGQDWIGDAEAMAIYGRVEDVYTNQYQDDPAKLLRETWEQLKKVCHPLVTATATVQDMEFVPGYEHQQVRLWDTVAIVRRDGTAPESTVTGIERDYVHPWLTKLKTGDEDHDEPSLAREMAKASASMEQLSNRVGGHGAGISENKQFIIRDREVIDLHTIKIKANGDKIQETELRMGDAEVSILAQQKQLDENEERISSAEFRLDGAEAKILLKVNKDGVIAAINLTPEEAKIQAAKINLEGYVTASQLSTEIANINNQWSSKVSTYSLEVTGDFSYRGYSISRRSRSVVTGLPSFLTAKVKNTAGNEISVVTGFADAPDRVTLYYLGDSL
ncbi:phage tail protein [Gemmiger formicilis]|uniref:phage tail protein n=1 Tax=Gemmiger formicilis TaxID=745368 RepID=UPI003AB65731